MDLKGIVYSAARDGRLHQLKAFLDDKPSEEVFSLVSARTNSTTPLVMACINGHLDIVLYLVERCNADIEQVGSVIFNRRLIQRAFPLWCAAAAGRLNIVKMLVTYNASVNCTTERNSTALHAACSQGELDIVKYLIQYGADFEIANGNGDTCLMSACSNGYYQITKHLLECGADMNRKTLRGNTALHDCAQRGNLDILKMLLQSGAKFQCNVSGSTPLLNAAIAGQLQVVEFLIQEFSCTKQEKIEALELLGSASMKINCNMEMAFEFWKQSMELRYNDDEFPLEKPTIRLPIASCIDATEFCTLQQLEELVTDRNKMSIQALLVVERILGLRYKNIFYSILYIGDRYLTDGYFRKCIHLWTYALDLQLKAEEPLNYLTLALLMRFSGLFCSMMQAQDPLERCLPSILFQHILYIFEKSLKILERDLYVHTTKKVENYTSLLHDILISAIYLVDLMCKLQPYLNMYENLELRKTVEDLVRLNRKGKHGWTLLHVACYKDTSTYNSSYIFKFPSPEVVNLLLEVGAFPNAVDAAKNTPLHVAAMNPSCSPAVFKALLNHGAHLDFSNYERKTPLQLAESMPSLDVYPMRYINLQCLCAQAIHKYQIDYEAHVHEKLKEFVDSH